MSFDGATLAHALEELRRALGTEHLWRSMEDDSSPCVELQEQFLDWCSDNRESVGKVGHSWLNSLASTDHNVLNAFLAEHGFKPMFQPFEDGIGAAAILDLLVKWQAPGTRSVIVVDGVHQYPAFSLAKGVRIYRVGIENALDQDVWCHDPLVEIVTESGISLWVMMTTPPVSSTQLTPFASKILQFDRVQTTDFGSDVILPMLDIENDAELTWLQGLNVEAPLVGAPGNKTTYRVVQAFQQTRIRMNHEGARAKVASGAVAVRESLPLATTFDRPFLGFFTLPADPNRPSIEELPLAPFFASFDSWKEPASL